MKLIVAAQHGLSVLVSQDNALWLPTTPLMYMC